MKQRAETAGWIIFVLSAFFFIAASWRAGDLYALAGSGLFLVACFVFMMPLASARR